MIVSEQVFLAATGAFLFSLIATRVVQAYAVSRSLLDVPNQRSSHEVPVPRLGGVAIVAAALIAWAVSGALDTWQQVVFIICALLLAGAGILDDLQPLSAAAKYLPQIVASAIVAIVAQPTLHVDLPFQEAYLSGWVAVVLVVVWITAVTNAFNFMDGVDGLAGSVAAFGALALSLLMQGASTGILIPFAAAVAGFLLWNMHPASIFMGDVGSQFLGFVLGASVLFSAEEIIPTIPVIVVFVPFLFDTGFTLIRRVIRRENVFTAHKSHLYQRLNAQGVGHRNVAVIYTFATGFAVVVAVAYRSATDSAQILWIAIGAALLIAFPIAIARVEQGGLSFTNPAPTVPSTDKISVDSRESRVSR